MDTPVLKGYINFHSTELGDFKWQWYLFKKKVYIFRTVTAKTFSNNV